MPASHMSVSQIVYVELMVTSAQKLEKIVLMPLQISAPCWLAALKELRQGRWKSQCFAAACWSPDRDGAKAKL